MKPYLCIANEINGFIPEQAKRVWLELEPKVNKRKLEKACRDAFPKEVKSINVWHMGGLYHTVKTVDKKSKRAKTKA